MSDIDYSDKTEEGDRRVRVVLPDYMPHLQEDDKRVRIPSLQEILAEVEKTANQAEDPETAKRDAMSALMLGAETGQPADQIHAAIEQWKKLAGDGSSERLFEGTFERLKSATNQLIALPRIYRHAFGDKSPENTEKVNELMAEEVNDEVFWGLLPQQVIADYTERLKAEVTEGVDPGYWDLWKHTAGDIQLKRELISMIKKDYGLPERPLWKDLIFSSAQTMPLMGLGIASAYAGAGVGTLIGGPQGAVLGSKLGGVASMSIAEIGWTYWDLQQQEYTDPETGQAVSMDDTVAFLISLPVGILKGYIEHLQWSTVMKPFAKFMQTPAYQSAAKEAYRQAVKSPDFVRVIASLAKKTGPGFVKRYTAEVAEEDLQYITDFFGTFLAKELNNRLKGTEFEHNWREFFPGLKETTIQAAKAMLLIQGGSSSLETVKLIPPTRALARELEVKPGVPKTEEARGPEAVTEEIKPGAEAKAEERPAEEARPETEEVAEEKPAKQRRTVGGVEYEFEEPTALEKGVLAVRSREGRIHSDPTASIFLDVADNLGIHVDEVVETGRIVNGVYIDEDGFMAWVREGMDEETLPDSAESVFRQALKKYAPALSEVNIEAAVRFHETRARVMGLSLEEYLHHTWQHQIASNAAPPDGSLEQFAGEELGKFNDNAKRIFGVAEDPQKAGWILSDGTLIQKSGIAKESHRLGLIPAFGLPELGYARSLEDFAAKGGAIRYNADFNVVQSFGKPTEAQLNALADLLAGEKVARFEITGPNGDLVAFDAQVQDPDLKKIRRFFGAQRPRAFFQGGGAEMDQRRIQQRAIRLFGLTKDPVETGYILTDGGMLDLSGRHQSGDYERAPDNTNRPKAGKVDWTAGRRRVDHRELFRQDSNPLNLRKIGTDGMHEFMKRSGAVRIDARAGSVEVIGPPTVPQIRQIARALALGQKAEQAASTALIQNVAYIDIIDEKGRSWASYTVPHPTENKLQRLFSNLQPGVHTYRQTGPIYHGSGSSFAQFSTEYIGTGQGATSFGWGLYFSSVEHIAREYAEMMAPEARETVEGVDAKGNRFVADKADVSYFSWMLLKDFIAGKITMERLQGALSDSIRKINEEYQRWAAQHKALAERGRRSDIIEYQLEKTRVEKEIRENHLIHEAQLLSALLENPDSVKIGMGKTRNVYAATLHRGNTPDQYTWLDWYDKVPEEVWKKIIAQAEKENVSLEAPPTDGRLKALRKSIKDNTEGARNWIREHRSEFKQILAMPRRAAEVQAAVSELYDEAVRRRDALSRGTPEYKKWANLVVEIGRYEWNINNLNYQLDDATRRINNNTGERLYKALVSFFSSRRQADAPEAQSKKEASLFLLRAGVDGVKYPVSSIMTGNRSYEMGTDYVVFDDRAISVDRHVLYQNNPNWKLKSRDIIMDKVRGPMPGLQILAMLKNNGVKDEEMKWIGLEEYLSSPENVKLTLLRQEGLSEENAKALLGSKKTVYQVVKETLEIHEAPNRSMKSQILGITEDLEEYESHRSAIAAAEEDAYERIEAILRQSDKLTPQQVLQFIADNNLVLREKIL